MHLLLPLRVSAHIISIKHASETRTQSITQRANAHRHQTDSIISIKRVRVRATHSHVASILRKYYALATRVARLSATATAAATMRMHDACIMCRFADLEPKHCCVCIWHPAHADPEREIETHVRVMCKTVKLIEVYFIQAALGRRRHCHCHLRAPCSCTHCTRACSLLAPKRTIQQQTQTYHELRIS